MKRKAIIGVLLVALCFAFKSKTTPQEYIQKYKDDAIKEMKRAGVPASITLAQGMLESSYGNSLLAKKAKNHFGIKCHSDWNGPTFKMDDDAKQECFRVYKSVWHSYRDHSEFLRGKKRYAKLFELKITDYKGWAKGLRKAGYATNPKYARLLIELIERYDLHEFDKQGKKAKKKKKKKEKKKNRVSSETGNDDFQVNVQTGRKILISDNWIKYVVVKKGDTFYRISKDTEISLRRLYKYNECDANYTLKEGERIYLQPKKRKAKAKKHVLAEGESMHYVAQKYGVKMKHLYKRNKLALGAQPKAGTVIILRGKKK